MKVKKNVKAKEISKWSMVISAVWISGWCSVKAVWGLFSKTEFGLTVWEIIISGLAIAASFSAVYFSIFFDKIKNIKINR